MKRLPGLTQGDVTPRPAPKEVGACENGVVRRIGSAGILATVTAGLFISDSASQVSARSYKPKPKGRAEYERICSPCHDLGAGTQNHRTREQWAAVVDDMVSAGAVGTQLQLNLVIEYLTENFGLDKKSKRE
jgi:hypothetical protein